jgi:hypothetical protein
LPTRRAVVGAPSAAPASPPAARRDRSIRARREARQARAERDQQIISLLNRGVSVAEIADRSGVSIRQMRKLVRKILAERTPAPPAEFLALQVSRLNEALLVSYSAMYNSMTGTNFEAVDRVVRIVRELDRYHGFAPVPRAAPGARNAPRTARNAPTSSARPKPARKLGVERRPSLRTGNRPRARREGRNVIAHPVAEAAPSAGWASAF